MGYNLPRYKEDMKNRTILAILDGFGYTENIEGNAILAAKTPILDRYFTKRPLSLLKTNGRDVGLPKGIMGNSEVGHLNIGAGRIVYQMNSLIDKMIEEDEFYHNDALIGAIEHCKENNSKLHLLGLISNGGVHSSLEHLYALLLLCKKKAFTNVYVHAIMDGRDTLPHDGLQFIVNLESYMQELGIGTISSISGRYYTMDRDNRWERVIKAYNAMITGESETFVDPIEAIKKSYENNITDEFIIPKTRVKNNAPVALIESNDSLIFFNFRADRAREITRTMIFDDFKEFDTRKLENLYYVTMTEYDIRFKEKVHVAFYAQKMNKLLGEVIANNGLSQVRIAETEKYAHVTFFFNGGMEEPYQNEDRILIPSPKVASYDMQPEMNAALVKDKVIESINRDKYDLIIVNFANCDMVGHTGVFDAAVKAVETVDQCIGEILPEAKKYQYNVIITADHGNAEKMIDEKGNIFTAHSMNEVPIAFIDGYGNEIELKNGKLADIAPTILKSMRIPIPEEMTGNLLY